MELNVRRETIESARRHLMAQNLKDYNVFEFSYGGNKLNKFLKFFTKNNGDLADVFYCVFNDYNLQNKMFVGTSAGAIFLGLVLLNAVSEYKHTKQIFLLFKHVETSTHFSKYLSITVALLQKEFVSMLGKNFPKAYLNLTLSELKSRLNMRYPPYFIYFEFPNEVKVCSENETLLDAMFKSSDIFGMKDGGFYHYLQSSPPMEGKSLVFSVNHDYKPLCKKHDYCYIF